MIKILYITVLLCFVEVQVTNVAATYGLKSVYKNGANKAPIDNNALVRKSLSPAIGKLIYQTIIVNKMLKKGKRKVRAAPSDQLIEESDTFAPDTILVDTDKVEKAPSTLNTASRSYNNQESLISMNEARKLSKHQPVKPIKYDIKLPYPTGNQQIPPHGHIDKDASLNLESRKLFIRGPNFPTTTISPIKQRINIKKTVKKDLSRIISNGIN